ncbi:MAG: HD domain-containing protein [Lachnospiraceae bacterium]|nr:HD domain-containing protein [Lachnospiraceae bacterium]
MTLDYNIFLELAVIPLDIILCAFLVFRYTNRTKVNVAFKRFAFAVMATDIVDVATAVVTSARDRVPNALHYCFNIADSMLAALSGFLFIYYVYAYVKMDASHYRARNIVNFCILGIDYLLLLTNPLTHLVFEYDEQGNYIHNVLFTPVAYGFPIVLFVIGSVYMLRHWKDYKKRQIVSLITAMFIFGILSCLQMTFFDNFLITFFLASLGVLVIYLSLETPEYERLLETMSALHESQAREAANAAKARLSHEVMLALSKAVDAKDHYTNGHSERVAGYTRELARRMGKSEKEQEDIYCMGLLHDVGKIGVSKDILNKKGKLTPEEFDAIKSHTTTGYDILKTITEIPGLSTGARWHHERYGGGGYPDGLCGEQIPEEARIICIADCYDAMTSRRSYSTPKSQAEVRAEILRCRGSQFDPLIADVMIRMIDEDKNFDLREHL